MSSYDFSKIEKGELHIDHHAFDLQQTVASTLEVLQPQITEKGLQVRSTIDTNVGRFFMGDSLRIHQVLLNLLSNAIKFTQKGGVTLLLRQEHAKNGRERLLFTVQDTGIGIKQENLERIFDSFAQEDASVTRNYGGTGLGLAISKELCSLMGGDISIESVLGEGTTVQFSVVVDSADPNLMLSNEKVDSALFHYGTQRLLVAEDNQVNRDLVKMTLEKYGHHITEAENGMAVLGLLAENDFDAILMDVQMPIMDGLTATKTIRALERGDHEESVPDNLADKLRGGHIPIVAMTAHVMDGDKEKCLNAGMDYYMSKPFKPEELSRILENFSQSTSEETMAPEEPAEFAEAQSQTTASKPTPDLVEAVKTHFKTTYSLRDEHVEQLFQTFLGSLQQNMSQAVECIDQHKIDELGAVFHTIKGILLNAGISDAVTVAVQLEKMAKKNEEISEISKYFKRLRSLLRQVV